jgi:hypothetical protein
MNYRRSATTYAIFTAIVFTFDIVRQQPNVFLCQINAIAKKQQFSSAKVSNIFRKRRHITFSQARNEQTVNATKDRGV